jgi:hypothetical protein
MAIRDNLLKLEGSVFVAPLNTSTDAFEGYLPDPIEARIFELSREEGEVTELKSKQRDRYGQVIDSDETVGSSTLRVEFLELTAAIRAILFAGTNTTFTQASGAVSNDPVVIVALDRWFPLANPHLNDAVAAVVTNVAGDVTYDVDDDYVIDYEQGMIKAVTGGTITAAQTVHVDYTKLAAAGVTTDGETNLAANFRIKFWGRNRYNEKDTYGEVWQVNLKSVEAVDLLSDEPITAILEGPMITPTGKTQPYYMRVVD